MSLLPVGRPFVSDAGRVRQFPSPSAYGKGAVVYVCDREMRVTGNRGLFFAAELANDRGVPLVVLAVSDTSWSHGNFRHLSAEADSFSDMASRLEILGIPLFPFFGDDAAERVRRYVADGGFSAAVFDFSPVRAQLELRRTVCESAGIPVFEVDSRCAVPARSVTDKYEV
ncbi:MAG: deoxyribodipyrimidine photo-lyase [Patescibacteria group bacterium]